MATVNPPVENTQPNYLNYSQGVRPDNTLAVGIEGASDILDKDIKAGMQYFDVKIGDQAETAVRRGQEIWMDKLASPMKVGADETPPPGDLTRRMDRTVDLSDAVKNGQLRESNYRMYIEAEARAMRNQYPGFRDLVDEHFQKLTSRTPASQALQQLWEEAKAGKTNAAKDLEYWERYTSHKGYVPDMAARASAGNPYTVQELKHVASIEDAKHAKIERDRSILSLNKDQGEANIEAAKKTFTNEASNSVNFMISKGFPSYDKLMASAEAAEKSAGATGAVDPKAYQEVAKNLTDLKKQVTDKIMTIYTNTDKNGYRHSDVIKEKKDVQGVIDAQLLKIDYIQDRLFNKDISSLGALKAKLDYQDHNDATQAMAVDPWIRRTSLLNHRAGNQWIALGAFQTPDFLEKAAGVWMREGIVRSLTNEEKAAAGKNEPDSLKAIFQDMRGENVKDPGAYRGIVKKSVDAIKTIDDPTTVAAAARTLFGKANNDFLMARDEKGDLVHNTNATHDMYLSMVGDPGMVDKMSKLKTTQPEVFANYKNWSIGNFYRIMQSDANTLTRANTDKNAPRIQFDPESNRFQIMASNTGQQQSYEFTYSKTVGNMNKVIDGISGVIKADGQDPKTVLPTLIGQLGIPNLTQAAPPTEEKGAAGKKAILNAIASKESGIAGYDAYYGQPKAKMSEMTIGEVLSHQQESRASGAVSTAAGKYQMIYPTLQRLSTKLGLDVDKTPFNPEVQDYLAKELLKERGIEDYFNGKISKEKFAENLSKEWAALPNPKTGKSTYEGKAGNKALMTTQQLYKFIDEASEGMIANVPGQGRMIMRSGKWQAM